MPGYNSMNLVSQCCLRAKKDSWMPFSSSNRPLRELSRGRSGNKAIAPLRSGAMLFIAATRSHRA